MAHSAEYLAGLKVGQSGGKSFLCPFKDRYRDPRHSDWMAGHGKGSLLGQCRAIGQQAFRKAA